MGSRFVFQDEAPEDFTITINLDGEPEEQDEQDRPLITIELNDLKEEVVESGGSPKNSETLPMTPEAILESPEVYLPIIDSVVSKFKSYIDRQRIKDPLNPFVLSVSQLKVRARLNLQEKRFLTALMSIEPDKIGLTLNRIYENDLDLGDLIAYEIPGSGETIAVSRRNVNRFQKLRKEYEAASGENALDWL